MDTPAELKLLDWFAGCALVGLCSSLGEDYVDTPTLEHDCYLIARAMLKARATHVRREDEEPPAPNKGGWSP